MRCILYLYWVIYEYFHFYSARVRQTLFEHIYKSFELYRTRPEWYERGRNLHAAQRNEIKGNKPKIKEQKKELHNLYIERCELRKQVVEKENEGLKKENNELKRK